ncbi:hypothetical protein BDQ17DRAFT_1334198 [Cyathus striatus]|nr:hypothetical protein BDQ17DRAFT_1334198 [Cyathus striatus]
MKMMFSEIANMEGNQIEGEVETLINVQSQQHPTIEAIGSRIARASDEELGERGPIRSKHVINNVDIPEQNYNEHSIKASQSDLGEGGAYAGTVAPITSLQKFTGTIVKMFQGGFRNSAELNQTKAPKQIEAPKEVPAFKNKNFTFEFPSRVDCHDTNSTNSDPRGSDSTIKYNEVFHLLFLQWNGFH